MSRYAKYCPSDIINQQPADTDYKFVYLAENTNISTIYTFQLRINLKYAKKKTRLIHWKYHFPTGMQSKSTEKRNAIEEYREEEKEGKKKKKLPKTS